MRFIKIISTLLMIFILLISLVFFARKQIALYSINHYFLASKVRITCIDFHLTPSLDVFVNKACINTPKADIEFVSVQLQLSSTLQLNAINVEEITIEGKAKLQKHTTLSKKGFDNKSFRGYLSKIAQLTLPLPITVKAFTYLPFYQLDNSQKTLFYGQLVANHNNINFSLKNIKQENILSAEFASKGENFTAMLSTDLAQLTPLLAIHQLALPAKLDKKTIIEGKLNTQLQWHNKVFTANSQLNDFSINSTTDIDQLGPFNIKGILSWQTTINADTALFILDEKGLVNINFSDKKLLEFITTKNISEHIVSLVKDNPTTGLIIKPQGRLQIDFTKQKIFISTLELTSKNTEKPWQLLLSDSTLSYETDQTFTPILNEVNYALNAELVSNKLNTLTKKPVKIISSGTLKQQDLGWEIAIFPDTRLELSALKLSQPSLSSIKNNNNILNIKKLITHWQGNIDFDHNGLAELSLQLSSQASMLQISGIALIEEFKMQAKVYGNLHDIAITASTFADNQPVANIKLSGEIAKPHLIIAAYDIALTELLALKVNLPIDISLIDGRVSYQLRAQLTDRVNWLNNTATLNVSMHDVTGEIDSTWIQELNWAQEFILSDGYIKTTSVDKKPKNNLTIAKIETAPQLSEFGAQTSLSFKDEVLSLKATEIDAKLLGGNVNIAKAQWPFTESRSVNIQLTSIDLEKLLALDPKEGIIITGKISGDLPVALNGKQFTISGGELHNISDGIIKVANNPRVEQLKESDPQLKLAFDAMQNIHYHQLSSDVSMANNGYMLFDTIIKGRNPDLDNDVNVNLNLSYDLLGLLKSLNFTKHLEQTLSDKLQKN
jgi:hypothetical protein